VTTRFSATKYVVYSKTLDLYWDPSSSGSLYYTAKDFSSLENATQFMTEQKAVERALLMRKQFDTVVFPLNIDATLSTDEVVLALSKKAQEAFALFDELNNMTDEKENSLTNAQIKKYKDAKRFLKESGLI
jgi:hypothetical protein